MTTFFAWLRDGMPARLGTLVRDRKLDTEGNGDFLFPGLRRFCPADTSCLTPTAASEAEFVEAGAAFADLRTTPMATDETLEALAQAVPDPPNCREVAPLERSEAA